MLFLLVACIVWLALVVGICAIVAAGGRADDRSEQWYVRLQRTRKASKRRKRNAA